MRHYLYDIGILLHFSIPMLPRIKENLKACTYSICVVYDTPHYTFEYVILLMDTAIRGFYPTNTRVQLSLKLQLTFIWDS